LAVAIRYALSRWEGLTLFIDDGRIELDNNSVERSIRPIASGSKSEELSLSKCLPGYP
jgi:transposase